MTQDPLIVVVVVIVAIGLVLGLIATILNRAKTPEHDLRRRALAIVAGFGSIPLGAAVAGSSLVAVAMVIAWAIVVVSGLYLALR